MKRSSQAAPSLDSNPSARRRSVMLALLVVGLYVIVPQLHVFHASLQSLHDLDYRQLALALAAIGLTFVLAATVYTVLALQPIRYGKTLIAELAANFINRLLPAGIGGIGANYQYLRRQKHTTAQAASVVAMNNGLGLVGHAVLLVVISLLLHGHGERVHSSRQVVIVLLGVCVVALVVLGSWKRLRERLLASLRSFGAQFAQYRTHPLQVATALSVQMCLTLANITAFYLCVHAVHAPLSFAAALLTFTVGFGVGAAVPTPGGLGGVEAGLAAGLVAYGITSPLAVAAVLVYRLVSYWIPLIVSGVVLLYASRRQYFN